MTEEPGLPPENGPERTCIVTRRKGSPAAMLRFVAGPDGAVVFDVRARLPGRGAWVVGEAGAVAAAVKRKAFPRAFRREVQVAADLGGVVEAALERDALGALAMVNKAGRVVCGTTKVTAALAAGEVAALLQAREAMPDGVRKVAAAARRGAAPGATMPPVVDFFDSSQMDLALGRANVIHAALLIGGVSDAFLERAARLSRFRGSTPAETVDAVGRSLPDDIDAHAGRRSDDDGGGETSPASYAGLGLARRTDD